MTDDPYEALAAIIERELGFVTDRNFDGVRTLATERAALVRTLPVTPPAPVRTLAVGPPDEHAPVPAAI